MTPNRLRIACLCLVAAAAFAGCASQERALQSASAPAMRSEEVGGSAAAGSAAAPDGAPPAAMPRKIVYTADVDIVTGDLDAAGARLTATVKRLGGYVSGADVSGTRGESRTGVWVVKVPSDRFEAFLGEMPGLGETTRSATRSEDVSAEFYDAKARLANKRVEEERLVVHLRQTAGRLTEILQVERELSRVRGEIEQIEGRLRFLSHQTDFSTVTLTLRELGRYSPRPAPDFGTRAARTLRESMETMGSVAQGFALALVALAPWLVALAAAAVPVVALARRGRRKP